MYRSQLLCAELPPSVIEPAWRRERAREASTIIRKRKATKSIRTDGAVAARSDPDANFCDRLLSLMPFLHAFSFSLCRNRELSEDLAQEALAKAWKARARFRSGTNMKAWLFTILRNEFYSHCRRAWRQESWDEAEAFIPGPDYPQDWAVQLSETAHALQLLPSDHRKALMLVGLGGFAYADAAAICHCPTGTTKSRVARARKMLLAALQDSRPAPSGAAPSIGRAAQELMRELESLMPRCEAGAAVISTKATYAPKC